MATDSVVDERTLRELYLTGFEIAVKEGKPGTIMTSYNLVNGQYANENEHLLMDILRREWGFNGVVVTDWGGSNDHALGVKYGSTLEMPAPGGDSVRELVKAVEDGKISESDVNDRLGELLTLIFETREALDKAPKEFDVEGHHALAKRAAAECAVLLKNEDGLLPLAAGTKVALIGDFAETPRYQGAGSSAVNTTKLDNLKDAMADSGLEVVGYAPGFLRHGGEDAAKATQAVELARGAEAVILCLGLDEISESEGLDRQHMHLAENQVALLGTLAAVNPNIAVVLHCGASVETPWVGSCKALLWAALGGQAGAGATVDLLTGKKTPCGKLAETWPVRYEDTPAKNHFGGKGRTVEYREGLFVGYRYHQAAGVAPAFPFGFGLSYTTFEYSDLKVDEKEVSLTVTNTGKVAGAEVVQLYVSKPDTALVGPRQQLKGFAKVALAPGESKTVSIPLDDKAYRYWNVKTDKWEIEGGDYELLVGASCEDIRLRAAVTVKGTGAPDPYEGLDLSAYRAVQVQEVDDRQFEALLGRPIPDSKPKIDRNMTFGELNHSRSPIAWLIWAIMTLILNSSLKSGKPNLNILFIYNMPLRALAKMAGGMVSMGMVDSLVMEFKGFWIIGLIRFLAEFVINLVKNSSTEKALKEA